MTRRPKPCLVCGQLTTNGARRRTCDTFRNRRGIGGWDWAKLRSAILIRDDYACRICGGQEYLPVHHRVPLADGGSNHPENLIALCRACHGGEHRYVI
jgi:5-methylcytosine-specific restriction endonuclease McrA